MYRVMDTRPSQSSQVCEHKILKQQGDTKLMAGDKGGGLKEWQGPWRDEICGNQQEGGFILKRHSPSRRIADPPKREKKGYIYIYPEKQVQQYIVGYHQPSLDAFSPLGGNISLVVHYLLYLEAAPKVASAHSASSTHYSSCVTRRRCSKKGTSRSSGEGSSGEVGHNWKLRLPRPGRSSGCLTGYAMTRIRNS